MSSTPCISSSESSDSHEDTNRPSHPEVRPIKRTEPRREQLDIVFRGDKATVTNGLGVEVESLVILSYDNFIFRHDQPLSPGESITLDGMLSDQTPSQVNLPQIATMLFEETEAQVPYTADWLKKGQYIAKTNEPIFYSTGMKPDVLNAMHFIIGKF